MNTAPTSYASGSPEETKAQAKDKMVAQVLFGTKYQAYNAAEDFKSIPHFAQTQRALDEQLRDLYAIANRLGLYDAADHIRPR